MLAAVSTDFHPHYENIFAENDKDNNVQVTHLGAYTIVVVIFSILIHKLHILYVAIILILSIIIIHFMLYMVVEMVVVYEQEDKSVNGYEYLFFS